MSKDEKKPKAGLGHSTMRKATRDEKKAFRSQGGRKLAKGGQLVEMYSAEKGGRLATSSNSGSTPSRTNTKSRSGKKSTVGTFGYGSSVGQKEAVKSTIAKEENAAFYGDTKFGQRQVNRAKRANPSASASGSYVKGKIRGKKKS